MSTKAKQGTTKRLFLFLLTRYYVPFDKEINYLHYC